MDDALVLRDIHPSMAPPWWPPAPGWWLVAGAVLLAVVAIASWWAWRMRRRRRLLALFDAEVDAASSPAEEVAAISALLRRAGRRRDPEAVHLEGEAWLAFLDAGRTDARFAGPEGRLLLDGPFRPDVDPGETAALRRLARERVLEWMEGRR